MNERAVINTHSQSHWDLEERHQNQTGGAGEDSCCLTLLRPGGRPHTHCLRGLPSRFTPSHLSSSSLGPGYLHGTLHGATLRPDGILDLREFPKILWYSSSRLKQFLL